LSLNFRERAVSRHRKERIKVVFKLYPSVKKRAGNSVFIHFPARFFCPQNGSGNCPRPEKNHTQNKITRRFEMKKCVMDNFQVLRELEGLAVKVIGVLNQSREIRSCTEAGLLRKSLKRILDHKEEKLEATLMKELIAVLGEIAEFAGDKERSLKSEDFKNLGNKINDFLKENCL
jgi:hypothetical protein